MSTLINIFSEMAQAIRIAEGSNNLYTPLNMPMAIDNLIQNVTYENVYNDDRDNQNYIAELKANLIGETTIIDSTLCANIKIFNQLTHIKSSLPVKSVEDTKYVVNHSYEVTDANNKYNGVSVLPDTIVVIGPSVTNIANIFYNASQLTSDLGNNIMVNAQGIVNMSGAFFNCRNLTGSPVCGPNVTDMFIAYYHCSNLTGSPVCGNNVIDMSSAYSSCTNLTGSPVCGNNVTSMPMAYINCYNLTGSPVCGPNVISMSSTYSGCTNLTGSPVCGPNVITMEYTYYDCRNLTGDIIIPESVEYIDNTFYNCRNLNSVTLPNKFNNGLTTNFWGNCPVSVANGNLIFY